MGGREDYERHYIDMTGSNDDYLARFSGKTRSTLRRKRRKMESESGGSLDLRLYSRPEEMDEFVHHAVPLSRITYQARLLDAGLPESEIARAEMRELAWQDRVRAFLLFLNGEPVAYLYLPVIGETLVYAYLGYDPAHANLSPGTVLQMAALESLFAEQRYRYFDFTEGEGAHKRLFGTRSAPCASFLLLRPTLANRALLSSLKAFDAAVNGSGLTISDRFFFGPSYAETLRRWDADFLDAWPKIERLGFDERFRRMWHYYLKYCEAGFDTGRIDVAQFVIERE